MAIPTLITELSETAALNAPAGSDSPSTLDDIQRAHAGFIAQLYADKVEATTLAASGGSALVGYLPAGTGAVATTVQAALRYGVVTPEGFGCLGDGTGDDAANMRKAITEALATGKKLFGVGSYRFESAVDFRQVAVDFSKASIDVSHAGIGVYIGGNASNGNNPEQHFFSVTRSVGADSTTTPAVRCIGAKGQHIYVDRTTYFQVYADTVAAVYATDYSTAYSSFWLKYVEILELTNNPTTTGSSIQWINENKFYLDRTLNILINGTYVHNHNKFYNGTLENTSAINIDSGSDNYFYGMRFEVGPTTITFGANASRNTIEKTWSSSESVGSIFAPIVSGTITDNGSQNQVYDSRGKQYSASLVARSAITDVVVNNKIGDFINRSSDLQKVTSSANGNWPLAVTGYIPVVSGDQYEFYPYGQDSGDAALKYRFSLTFFDKNLKVVSSATGFVSSAVLTTVSGGSVGSTTGAVYAMSRITAAGAAGAVFLKAYITASYNQLSGGLARILDIKRYSKELVSNNGSEIKSSNFEVVTAIPTTGFAPVGFTCIKSDGVSLYVSTFALDTTLSAGAAALATVMAVTSGTGTVNGDIVGVNLDDRSTHWTTIASGGGTASITLTAGIPSAAASGSRIVFNRWATK